MNDSDQPQKPHVNDHLIEAHSEDPPRPGEQTAGPVALVEAKNGAAKPAGPTSIVFQWLAYAFWGWSAIVTGILAGSIAYFLMDQFSGSDYTPIAYLVASLLILLPAALISDVIFSKSEVDQKHGFSMVIMVIHAVLYALIAVGALATVVYMFVTMLLSSTNDTAQTVPVIVAASTVVVLFAVLLVRILKPAVNTKLRLLVRLALTVIIAGAALWAVFGPIAETYAGKDDQRAINAAQSIPYIASIYIAEKNELPNDLEQMIDYAAADDVYPEADLAALRQVVDEGVVTYKANIKEPVSEPTLFDEVTSVERTYFYEVCVTFERESQARDSKFSAPEVDEDGYNRSIYPGPESGKQCFKLKISNMKSEN